jgi:hypothetical protein
LTTRHVDFSPVQIVAAGEEAPLRRTLSSSSGVIPIGCNNPSAAMLDASRPRSTEILSVAMADPDVGNRAPFRARAHWAAPAAASSSGGPIARWLIPRFVLRQSFPFFCASFR